MNSLNTLKVNKSVQLITRSVVLTASLFQAFPVAHAASIKTSGEHWSERQIFSERKILQSQFVSNSNMFHSSIDNDSLTAVLEDSEHKIAKDFEIPQEMKESVKFWLKIYTQFSTRQVVLVDANHMDVIYDVIDLRPLAAKSRNQVVYEILSDRLIKRTLDKYRQAFTKLSNIPHSKLAKLKNLSHEESRILAATKNLPHSHHHSFIDLKSSLKVMRGQRDQIISGLVAGENYLPKMEQIFAKMGVPVELTRIAMVESSLNIKAGSRVGARGMWQIMPATGKAFLKIDENGKIDERISPFKSTIAAAKLLKWNYKYLGSWILSIIAYNHGHSGMPRFHNGGFEFSKVAYLFNPCQKHKHLGFASRNYYFEFLALVHAIAYQSKVYGDSPVPALRPITFHKLEKAQTAASIIAKNGISLGDFQGYNPDVLDTQKELPKGFWVASPSADDKVMEFLEHLTHKKTVKKAPALKKFAKNMSPKKARHRA